MPNREKLLRLVVPAVLFIVAGRQYVLVQTRQMTPWKGGGFGMFATTDRSGTRFTLGYLDTGTEEILIAPEELREFGPVEMRARIAPDPASLARLGRQLLKQEWKLVAAELPADFAALVPERVVAARARSRESSVGPVRSVRIEVWRTAFESEGRRLSCRRLASESVSNWELVALDGQTP